MKIKPYIILSSIILILYSCYALMDSSHQTVCYAYETKYQSYHYVPDTFLIHQYYGTDNCNDISAFQRSFLTSYDTSIYCIECVVLAEKCAGIDTCFN
jgi:hypothetical protein